MPTYYPADPVEQTYVTELERLIGLSPKPSYSFYDNYYGWKWFALTMLSQYLLLRRKVNDLYEIYADTADALVGANNDIAQRDITIGDLATQIGSLTTLINSLSTDNTETKKQRDEAIAQRDGLQWQLGELQTQLGELQTQRDGLQTQYDTALGELGDTTKRLGDVQDTVGTYENKWREDNPEWDAAGLDFKTFIGLTDAFVSEDSERIGRAISTLEGMGINPADIKGETFEFGDKEYVPTDPPEIPLFDDEEEREKFNEEVKKFFEGMADDEEAKLELYNKLDEYKATMADDNATELDKSGALSSLVEKAGPLGRFFSTLVTAGSAVAGFLQPGEDETPGGEPVTDYRLPKITRKTPDLGLDIPIPESLVNLSKGGFIKKPVPPPAPKTFLTGVQPGEEKPLGELKYEDKYVGLFPEEDKEGDYLQYPSPFGKDKLEFPETALLETALL